VTASAHGALADFDIPDLSGPDGLVFDTLPLKHAE
jgi:hypothetical protein